MFDRGPQADTNTDFPVRNWIAASCANPLCLDYANTDAFYPKAGRYKERQRYKCKRCHKTFYKLDQPEGKFRPRKPVEKEEAPAQPETELQVAAPVQPEAKEAVLVQPSEAEAIAKPEADLHTEPPKDAVPVKPETDVQADQPEAQPAQRKKVSFLLSHQAVQGLHKVCASLGIESDELLEQIGQGTLAVRPS